MILLASLRSESGRHGRNTWTVSSVRALCELLIENKLHFILTCKPDSHPALYQELELLTKVKGAHQTHMVRRWNKNHYEQWHYHWVEQVPIRAGE